MTLIVRFFFTIILVQNAYFSFSQDCHCQLEGTYDLWTKLENRENKVDWHDCENQIYEGEVMLIESGPELYSVLTAGNDGEFLEDMSFGAYHECYMIDDPNSLPLGNLILNNTCGLMITGASQWGEIYNIQDVTYDDKALSFY